jgi:tetratricopeptide (TPR) repeat protein
MGRLQGSHRQELVQLVALLDASFNYLSEKLQRVLLSLVVLRWGFDGVTATAISGETVTDKELRELGKRGFLASETRVIYTFLPLILEYLKYRVGDLTVEHLKAIEFYQSRFKSRDQWRTVEDVREYLEVFYHCCELGEYKAAFDVIYDGSNSDNCVAKFLELRGNNQLRAELYQELVEHLTDKQDWRYTASLTSLGNAYYFLGRYEEALSYYQQSLEIEREIEDRQGEAISLNNLGIAYNSLGRYEEAISYYQQSLEIYREIGNRRGIADSLNGLGAAYYFLVRYQEAISYYQQSLEIQREIGNRRGVAASLNNLGRAYNSLVRYEEALSYYQQSLEIYREIGDRRGVAASLNGLGNVYNSLGRYEDAISYHQQSLEIQREIGNRRGVANSLYNLGNDYDFLGRYEDAISYYQQSLDIDQEIGDRRGVANSLNNLGNDYDSLGRYEEAISYYQQSLEIRREIGDRRKEADSLLILGNLYQKIGGIKEGFAASQQAQLIYQELDLSFDANPFYPNWMKKIAKFAQRNKFNLVLCFIIGVFAFPFALVGIILLMFYRIIRSRFPHR